MIIILKLFGRRGRIVYNLQFVPAIKFPFNVFSFHLFLKEGGEPIIMMVAQFFAGNTNFSRRW